MRNDPLTEEELEKLFKILEAICFKLMRLFNQGAVLDETFNDERIGNGREKIENWRIKIAKEQSRIRKLQDYLKKRRATLKRKSR